MNLYNYCAIWFIFGFLVGVVSSCLILVQLFKRYKSGRDSAYPNKQFQQLSPKEAMSETIPATLEDVIVTVREFLLTQPHEALESGYWLHHGYGMHLRNTWDYGLRIAHL